MKDQFVELRGPEVSTTNFVISVKDIVGTSTYTCNFVPSYSVIVRGITQWFPVDAESYFKVRSILKEKLI